MYKGISTSPTDLLGGMNLPILGDVPNQSIPMQSNFSSELNLNSYETKIFSNTSILYKNILDWKNVYIVKLPNQLASVPALITQSGKICLNMTVAAVHLNMVKNNIVVEDANDFSAAVLFGLNMLLLTQKQDPSLLSVAFHSIVDFIHSLITQVYAFEIDFSKINNQDIANMYCAVAKMVINNYLGLEGTNVNGVARTLTHYFFSKDTRSRIPYDPALLPITPDISINNYAEMFEYFNTQGILPSTSLEDFRNKVITKLSLTALMCMVNGLTFTSMLLTSRLPSNVFNDRVNKVKPQASNSLFSAVLQVLTKEYMDKRNEERQGGLLTQQDMGKGNW